LLVAVLSLCLALLLAGAAQSAVLAVQTPTGFSDTPLTPVSGPTALAFTTDGRLLIATQSGALRVYQNGALLPSAALNLGTSGLNVVCSNHERGLLGVAVGPAFAANRFIYLYYTFNKFPNPDPAQNCPDVQPTNPSNPVNRVSRFVLPDTNVIDPASESILVDNMPSTNGNHNSGDLRFGSDGYLYISIGDGGC